MTKVFPFGLGAHIAFTILLLTSAVVLGCHGLRTHSHPLVFVASSRARADIEGDHVDSITKEKAEEEAGMETYPAGSTLPDCSHACGPCVPCKRVMVSYKCSTESCPVVYRCVCKGKYYHVPSH